MLEPTTPSIRPALLAALLLVLLTAAPRPLAATVEVLYVVEFSHADVGFNAPPSEMQQRNHDRTVAALDVADADPDFRWTLETAYQLESFLDRAVPADVDRLRARLSEGRFAVAANYLNLHSGLCGEEEIHRLLYEAFRDAPALGFTPRTALLDDVPGFSAAIPRALAAAGVPYALLGPNDFVGGKPDIPLADRPFWWEGRDGSRVLTWMTYGSYIEGFFDWGLNSLFGMQVSIPARVQEFEDAGYPYDALLVARASDDEFPSATMADLARQWNAQYAPPRIELSTAADFFEHMTTTYGDVFPAYRGDASGLWEDVCVTTPASVGIVRRARTALPAVEALQALFGQATGAPVPLEPFRQAWSLAMILDDHSNGGYGWPGLLTEAEIRQENEEFVAVANGCGRITDRMRDDALDRAAPKLVPAGEAGLVLLNPIGDAFDGIVEVTGLEPQPADLRLADPAGGPDAEFRWLDDGRTAFALRTTVPARGWRRWRVTGGGSAPPPPAWTEDDSITAGGRRLTVDPADGAAISLVRLADGFDWLDQPGPHRFGGIEFALHLEEFFGLWSPMDPGALTVRAEAPAPLFRRIEVRDGAGRPILEYRLHESGPRVDVSVAMRTSTLPFVPYDDHSHHYGIAFPANLDPPTTLWIDGPDGEYRPGAESLPGAALGHFAAATGARLEGASGRWLAVTSLDTPMLSPGEMNGAPLDSVETDERGLVWKLRRHADLSEVSGGDLVPMEAEPGMPDAVPYAFRVRFGEAGDPPPGRETMRHDIAPPFAAWVPLGEGSPGLPAGQTVVGLTGSAEMVCLKRSEADDGLVVRLRSDAGGTATLTPMRAPASAWLADLVEHPLSPLSVVDGAVDVPLVAGGVVTVLLQE